MAYAPSMTRAGGGSVISPAPRAGQGPYGKVPGAIGTPDRFNDLAKLYPNLGGANAQVSQNIMSELQGELSPEAINAIRDSAATFGVTSGMPGSGLAQNRGLRDLGLETAKLQGQGLQDYLAAITGISNTQTVSPELQTQIATQNSVWNSAPDPEAAALEQERLFEEYMKRTESPAGGTGGTSRDTLPWYMSSAERRALTSGRGARYNTMGQWVP